MKNVLTKLNDYHSFRGCFAPMKTETESPHDLVWSDCVDKDEDIMDLVG
jgi:hypothetical protein